MNARQLILNNVKEEIVLNAVETFLCDDSPVNTNRGFSLLLKMKHTVDEEDFKAVKKILKPYAKMETLRSWAWVDEKGSLWFHTIFETVNHIDEEVSA